MTPMRRSNFIEASAHALLDAGGGGEMLVLTDVFGATPANVAQRLAEDPRVRVVAGVNVPMSALPSMRTNCRGPRRGGRWPEAGVMQVASLRPQNQTKAAVHDPDQRHHQQ